ncbi:MAG: endonuclease III domain-containing protein [Candidatus Micrarchaeia archaeon]
MPANVELILSRLYKKYGRQLHTQLKHRNNTELFVAVLLSPQCTDTQTNKVTSKLFKHFKTFEDYANANLKTLQSYMRGLNYYKTKAKYLKAASRQMLQLYHGKVPRTMKELLALDGVGRKVANVILHEAYGINEGIAVDTHVKTTARRLGLTKSDKPEVIEKDLMRQTEQSRWGDLSNLLIALGRDTCKAARKECYRCVLNDICPSSTARKTKIVETAKNL